MTVQLPPDRLLDRTLGDFVIREKLGRGAFGVVYRAEQPTLAREVAVKVLYQSHQKNPLVIERFLREARLASRLDHPFAVHIYASGAEPDGVLWIAMELVHGKALDELLRAQGPIPLLRFAPLLERLCEVVNAAHDQGIVHRDLKPANVMVLSRAGRLSPKLLDFGVAKFLDLATGEFAHGDEERNPHATRAGAVVGSPSYMAPEQWVAPGAVDARTDLYAMGVLTFEALTGRLPFTGATVKAVAAAHARNPLPPLGLAFPVELDAVLARVTAKQPAARPASALEFAAAFRAAAVRAVEKPELLQLP
jgi:eukaryotic-like serine/threonine-protein kinase